MLSMISPSPLHMRQRSSRRRSPCPRDMTWMSPFINKLLRRGGHLPAPRQRGHSIIFGAACFRFKPRPHFEQKLSPEPFLSPQPGQWIMRVMLHPKAWKQLYGGRWSVADRVEGGGGGRLRAGPSSHQGRVLAGVAGVDHRRSRVRGRLRIAIRTSDKNAPSRRFRDSASASVNIDDEAAMFCF
jgi:hypothetical protein